MPYILFRFLYAVATNIALPFMHLIQKRRIRAGKEDPLRAQEREGIASIDRPEGRLLWFHAASIGESLAVLPVIERIIDHRQDLSVLITTGTLTSARILEERLPKRAFHQFVPFDRLAWIRAFLDFWKPDMVIWVESELWPNTLHSVKQRDTPLILVNGRMSQESYKRWKFFPSIARGVIGCFDQCLMQSADDARNLKELGAINVVPLGNLKYGAPPLPYDKDRLESLRSRLASRPVWLFASTHEGEEKIAADIHRALEGQFPGLLTIIVPRHPVRGPEIASILRGQGATVSLHSAHETPQEGTGIHVADSIGELGLYFRLCPIVCMGKSLIPPGGGQNPFEAAQLGCAVLFGPFMGNFEDFSREMVQKHAALQVSDGTGLKDNIAALLSDATRLKQQQDASLEFSHGMENIVGETVSRVLRTLDSRND